MNTTTKPQSLHLCRLIKESISCGYLLSLNASGRALASSTTDPDVVLMVMSINSKNIFIHRIYKGDKLYKEEYTLYRAVSYKGGKLYKLLQSWIWESVGSKPAELNLAVTKLIFVMSCVRDMRRFCKLVFVDRSISVTRFFSSVAWDSAFTEGITYILL